MKEVCRVIEPQTGIIVLDVVFAQQLVDLLELLCVVDVDCDPFKVAGQGQGLLTNLLGRLAGLDGSLVCCG